MPVITKDTGIIEAVQKYPQIVQIFSRLMVSAASAAWPLILKPLAKVPAHTALT